MLDYTQYAERNINLQSVDQPKIRLVHFVQVSTPVMWNVNPHDYESNKVIIFYLIPARFLSVKFNDCTNKKDDIIKIFTVNLLCLRSLVKLLTTDPFCLEQ